jgi:DNA modification methylase
MEQYYATKAECPGCLLLWRMGDFYEAFGEDAEVVSSLLGLVLTTQSRASESPVVMAGFPHHQIETYTAKLVELGRRVAICEQIEQAPGEAKIDRRIAGPPLIDDPFDIEESPAATPVARQSGEINCISQWEGNLWKLYHGDSCEVLRGLPDASVDLCIHSPPFQSLFIYSDSEADLGNSSDEDEFMEHYRYCIAELLRVTVTGRLCIVHCKDLPKYQNRDGTAGLIDFPGQIIRAFEECDPLADGTYWSYHSRVTIWKCPVTERERTNNNGLLHKTVLRDRSQLRQGMADFLLVFRKAPVGTLMSDKPVKKVEKRIVATEGGSEVREFEVGYEYYVGSVHPRENDSHPSPYARKNNSMHGDGYSIDVWRRYAEPVWWDVDQTDVLNYRQARSERDERHICPLQVDLIRRCIHIWSNPSDVVLSPFAGIGSEGVGAIREGRRFVGVELKEDYCRQAVKNLKQAEEEAAAKRLFV